MMKLGGRCIVQKSRPSSNLKVIAPWMHTPKNPVFGYDIGKIGAGCLVLIISPQSFWLALLDLIYYCPRYVFMVGRH